jgi:hypothetical protein
MRGRRFATAALHGRLAGGIRQIGPPSDDVNALSVSERPPAPAKFTQSELHVPARLDVCIDRREGRLKPDHKGSLSCF